MEVTPEVIIVAAVVGLVVGVDIAILVWGATRPPVTTVTRTLRSRRSPEEVWRVLTDYPGHATWRPGITSVEKDTGAEGREIWTEKFGGQRAAQWEVVESRPPTRWVRQTVQAASPLQHRWEFEIRPAVEGSKVSLTLRMEVRSPFLRAITSLPALFKGPTAPVDTLLRQLSTKLGDRGEID